MPGEEGKEAKEEGLRGRREGGGGREEGEEGCSLASQPCGGRGCFWTEPCLHSSTFLRTGLDPSRGEALYLLSV